MALRGQRGTIRVEGKSYIGYYSTYSFDPATGKNKRKPRSVELGPKALTKFQAYKVLAGIIEQARVLRRGVRPDSAATLEEFTRKPRVPLKEASWRDGTRKSAEHILGVKSAENKTVNPEIKGTTVPWSYPTCLTGRRGSSPVLVSASPANQNSMDAKTVPTRLGISVDHSFRLT